MVAEINFPSDGNGVENVDLDELGTYSVECIVEDSTGLVATDETTIEVITRKLNKNEHCKDNVIFLAFS